jgi:hypothetical protein
VVSRALVEQLATLVNRCACGLQADSFCVCMLRCTSLQSASFTHSMEANTFPWSADTVCFEGQGSTPDERCASMQQQLAMLRGSPHFLAPTSWPACSVLTHLVSKKNLGQRDAAGGLQLNTALQTPSLVSLHVRMDDDVSASAVLQDLSRLCKLTDLAVWCPRSLNWSTIQAAIAGATNLRSLAVWSMQGTHEHDGPAPEAPCSWSKLSRLTQLQLTSLSLSYALLQALSILKALEHLAIDASGIGAALTGFCLPALFPLTCLTKLSYWPADEGEAAILPAAAETGGMQQATLAVPAAWRRGLKDFLWSGQDTLCIPVVAHLTSMVSLAFVGGVVTPELCRCAVAKCVPLAPAACTTVLEQPSRAVNFGSLILPNI